MDVSAAYSGCHAARMRGGIGIFPESERCVNGLSGTLTIRTRPGSTGASVVKSKTRSAAAAAGRTLSRSDSSLLLGGLPETNQDLETLVERTLPASEPKAVKEAAAETPSKGDAICPPRVRLEKNQERDIRRMRGHSASDDQVVARRFVAAPALRQPDEKDGDAVVSYAQDLISAGWVFVVQRVVQGKNWLAPDNVARSLWRREPGWGDVIEMLETPSEYLSDEVEISIHADKGGEPALTRPFLRPPPTDIGAFKTDQHGYAKFYFESVGPEELVLLSFHEGKKRKGRRK